MIKKTILLGLSIILTISLISCRHRINEHPEIIIKDAVTDVDGNVYDAVKIGSQIWMASNLKTTHYADGTAIPDGEAESSDSVAYRYAPANNDAYVRNYGYLYNWPAVMHGEHFSNDVPSGVQGICPEGWHLPSNAEWKVMVDYIKKDEDYMGVSQSVAKALAAPYGWQSSTNYKVPGRDMLKNNSTGFTALPAGNFVFGNYSDQGVYAYFWTSMRSADYFGGGRSIGYDSQEAGAHECSLFYGLSVRCIKNDTITQ